MIDAERLIAECQRIATINAPLPKTDIPQIERAQAVSAAPMTHPYECVRVVLAVNGRSMFIDLCTVAAKMLAVKLCPELLLRRPLAPSHN